MRYDLATDRPSFVTQVPQAGCPLTLGTLRHYERIWKAGIITRWADKANSVPRNTLLDGVGAAAGACRPTLALLELEGQYVEQAINTIGERLEHRLFLERRDVEMKAQEVDQRGAAQAALLNDRAPSLLRG